MLITRGIVIKKQKQMTNKKINKKNTHKTSHLIPKYIHEMPIEKSAIVQLNFILY